MTLQQRTRAAAGTVQVRYEELHAWVSQLFTERGMPPHRARTAASALCHGDLTGFDSHGVFNLSRLYLPLFDSGRVDPAAEPEIVTDTGACAVVDSRRALGLWSAAEAMDTAVERAGRHGIGLVSVRDATHFGCAGYHATRAAERGMVGIVASNCGGQRIARPPLGALTMLGTNPLAVAAPALPDHPFVLDMSTTVVPTGKVRIAASRGETIPPGWLTDDAGNPVTDPAVFDRGTAHLGWLGGSPETGAYKGYGLGLVVELLAALLPGADLGPAPAALQGDGGPHGRDDGIGFFVLAIAPDLLRPDGAFGADAHTMFTTLADCPPAAPGDLVRYPGWWEAERALERHRCGVPIPAHVHRELLELGLPGTEPAGEHH
ncbi:Ldh family oxidoreductase [Saccharopolyspora sp. ASAGF58]|uniref:Ldh family oxidoreductase n=1 Tax=Saccharopolyspora sp. ASAGF58 TaxID=2719023 RepID=UPI00143FF473|nr:Ldh family oxidoreductase [Saccharopolyspora sp. ASAGF58]QIZ38860.1 Ldh family oxidoreductase [Saccharopolyspora sp. ASAGF58]